MTMGGLFLILEQNWSQKNKNRVFCILCIQMSGQPAAPGYATAFSYKNRHFAF